MRPEREGAGRPWGQPGAAEESTNIAILADRGRLGNCANCGIRIDLRGGALNCRTCLAWHRWYSAHRLASRYLQETAR
jgi:hypothetical protein